MRLSEILEELFTAHGITKTELAKRLRVTPVVIYAAFRGDCSYEVLLKLLKEFGLDIETPNKKTGEALAAFVDAKVELEKGKSECPYTRIISILNFITASELSEVAIVEESITG